MPNEDRLIEELEAARRAAGGGQTERLKLRFAYGNPDPFVLPLNKFGEKHFVVPFDGRYIEEIMFYINRYRTEFLGLERKVFNLYDAHGNPAESYVPTASYVTSSRLNKVGSIVNFAQYIEDLKEAIEEIIVSPDTLQAHFGRCFNRPHFNDPYTFISQGLHNQRPAEVEARLTHRGEILPFYNFPDTISKETLYNAFNKFRYYLPSADHPARQILIDAFKTANRQLPTIPMFERMENGEWPLTKNELLTLLGLAIYGKHPDPIYRPTERDGYASESERYILSDHKRIFWAVISFMIQALRFHPPLIERFRIKHASIATKWWLSRWFWRVGEIAHSKEDWFIEEFPRQGVNKMWRFENGYYHMRGHGAAPGDGFTLDMPLDRYGTSTRERTYDDGLIGLGPGLLGIVTDNARGIVSHFEESVLTWFAGSAFTDIFGPNIYRESQPDKNHYFFHKYSNLIIGGSAGAYPGSGPDSGQGVTVVLRIDDGDASPFSIYAFHGADSRRGIISMGGLPVNINPYDEFKSVGADTVNADNNWLKMIGIRLAAHKRETVTTPTTAAWCGGYIKDCGRFCETLPECCDIYTAFHHPCGPAYNHYTTGGEVWRPSPSVDIPHIAIVDDKIHKPEDFLED
jgi:hypothetical protein